MEHILSCHYIHFYADISKQQMMIAMWTISVLPFSLISDCHFVLILFKESIPTWR